MAIIRKKELKNMNEEELKERLDALRIELMKEESKIASKQASQKRREIKKTIARILTMLNQKQKKQKK